MEIFDNVIEFLLGASAYTAGVSLLATLIYTSVPM